MKIVHLSYARIKEYSDPEEWLKKLDFFTGSLEVMAKNASVISFHCISYSGTLNINGVTYRFISVTSPQQLFPFKLHSEVSKCEPDIVIVHGLIFPWQVLLLRWRLKKRIKIIVQHHAERPLRRVRRLIQLLADNYIHAYLFCSLELGQQWVDQKLIKDGNKICEIMEGSSPFKAMDRMAARSVTGISEEFSFLWIGGLHKRKNPLLAVRAFIRFAKLCPNAKLHMIYQSCELIDELKSLIAEADAFEHINLVGPVKHDELIYWYNSAYFVLATSNYEGSGLAVCEAMSCGCIPILTDIPSFRMMTGGGNCGQLYSVGDEEELVQTLGRSIKLDIPKEKNKVLDQFDRNLSFEAIGSKTLEILNKL